MNDMDDPTFKKIRFLALQIITKATEAEERISLALGASFEAGPGGGKLPCGIKNVSLGKIIPFPKKSK